MVIEERFVSLRFAHLLATKASNLPPADTNLLWRAFAFSSEAHCDQKRATGEAYVTHPVAVMEILMDLRADTPTMAGALLHDVIEDSGVTRAQLVRIFGSEVASLVDGVTKHDLNLRFAADLNYMKFRCAAERDPRTATLKLADRLHNLQTLAAKPPHKRVFTARETLQVFVPLAVEFKFFYANTMKQICEGYITDGDYQ